MGRVHLTHLTNRSDTDQTPTSKHPISTRLDLTSPICSHRGNNPKSIGKKKLWSLADIHPSLTYQISIPKSKNAYIPITALKLDSSNNGLLLTPVVRGKRCQFLLGCPEFDLGSHFHSIEGCFLPHRRSPSLTKRAPSPHTISTPLRAGVLAP